MNKLCVITFLALQTFVQNQPWQSERGEPISRAQKDNWIQAMNSDTLSDLAAITYCPNADYVELWYTKFEPFSEKGMWVVIPGIRQCIRQIENTERLRDRVLNRRP